MRETAATTTILRILKKTEEKFKSEGIQNPRLDAEALLSKVLGLNRVGLYTEYERILTEEEIDSFLKMVERRLRREPLQYILGSTEFYGLEFLVTPDVLIPRPETELLVEEAIKLLTVNGSRFTILDLCTGSGCIAIAIAKNLRLISGRSLMGSKIYAIDISAKALNVARENARRHKVEDRINFIQGDLFGPFMVQDSWFNLIVSNPPYIPSHEIDHLQPEVSSYEPRKSLDGGPDGLRYIEKIIEEAPTYLSSGGSLLLEIGHDQRDRLLKMMEEKGVYQRPEFIKDHAGIDRVVKVRIVKPEIRDS